MTLLAIKNYFYFRNALKRCNKVRHLDVSELKINILFAIYSMDEIGLNCTRAALTEFMSDQSRTPNKRKLFAIIREYITSGLLMEHKRGRYLTLDLSLEGLLLLSKMNEKILCATAKVKKEGTNKNQ